MRLLLILIAFIGSASLSYSKTVSTTSDGLNSEFSFSEGNQLSAELKTEYGKIDNFLRSKEEQQDTSFIAISPELFIQTQGDGSVFQLQAKANYFTFDEFSNDDHHNFSLLSKFHLKFAESQKVFVTGSISKDYEYRGTGLTLGEANSIDEGDSKRNKFFNAGYLYGHQDSLARIKFLVGNRDFAYLTRKEVTEQQTYSSNYAQGHFDYLITGNTYVSTKVQFEDFNYDANIDLARKQYVALAGVKWRSSELTELQLLMGYEKAIFDNNIFEDNSRFAWQANMLWQPLSRVTFDLSAGSAIKDAHKVEKSISYSDYFNLGVNYDFSDRLQIKVSGKAASNDVVSIDNTIKEEQLALAMGLNYQWRNWLSALVQFHYNTFDSNRIQYDYDLKAISVGINVTL